MGRVSTARWQKQRQRKRDGHQRKEERKRKKETEKQEKEKIKRKRRKKRERENEEEEGGRLKRSSQACHVKLGPNESPKIYADTTAIKPQDGKVGFFYF